MSALDRFDRLRRLGRFDRTAGAVLGRLAERSVARPRTTLALAATLLAVALGWAATRLELRTSNLDLIDSDLPPVAAFRDLAREVGTPNSLVVVLEGWDEAALRRTVDRLVPRLAAVPGTRSVLGRLPGSPGAFTGPAGGLGGAPGVDPYFTGRHPGEPPLYFLFVQPEDAESRAETIAPWVEAVRRVVKDGGEGDERGEETGGGARVTTGLTGLPQYAVDDRDAVQRDLTILSPVSFLLILGLFVSAFRALRRPLAAMAALAVAVGVTVGVAALWPGHLTLLSAFFGSILFGLGVDFGIHVVDRTEELLARNEEGGAAEDGDGAAAVAAVRALAPALASGALTTASAFGVMVFSGFRGFAELGAIAGFGVPLCLLAMVTVLPALLALPRAATRERDRRGVRQDEWGGSRPGRLGALLVRVQSPWLAALVAAAALVGPLVARPAFDSDYLNLEPKGSEAVSWEREMVRRSPYSPQFAAFVAPSREAAEAVARRLAADPTVGEVHWAADLDLLRLLGPGPEEEDGAYAALRQRFVGPSGRFAVYAYPRENIWDEGARDRFLAHMAAIDPGVTGLPVLGRFMIDRSRRALRVTGVLAAAAIFLWVLADLRDPRLALLAVLPTLLGAGGMVALMALSRVSFNPLDVMALPVVLGIAVDDGVHVVHRFLAERGDLGATLRGTGRSVVLTSLTSLAAFGVLAAARHQGLASFGAAAGLGVAAALATSVLVLPQALVAWQRRQPDAARPR